MKTDEELESKGQYRVMDKDGTVRIITKLQPKKSMLKDNIKNILARKRYQDQKNKQ
jgi:hypothetical protein